MAKIAVLLPREYMLGQVRRVMDEQPHLKENVIEVSVAKTETVVETARRVIDQGAHIIVARGLQAKMIKEYTKVPVVEIVITTQEVGLMIRRAIDIVKKPYPKIAMVTLKNAVADTSYVNHLFDVTFRTYCAENIEELERMVGQAVEEGADIIIGGDKVERIGKQYSIPTIFSISTEDSIRNALSIAQKMSYTADVEQEYHAQMETILDTAFNGIVKIDTNQRILMMNRMMEELLGKEAADITGHLVEEILPMDDEYIKQVLDGRQESTLTSVNIKGTPLMVMIAPIKYNEAITGGIISCHKLKSIINRKTNPAQDMYLSGFVARGDFNQFYSREKSMRNVIELAKKYALSRYPVLIEGYDEMENALFAQSIHNNSLRKNSPFVSVNCAHLNAQEQISALFGNPQAKGNEGKKGILEQARYGTVFIREIDKMAPACQYQMLRMVSPQGFFLNDADQTPRYDVRLIASVKGDLKSFVDQGDFRSDFYYALKGLSLKVPALSERKQDVEYLCRRHLKEFKDSYSRYLVWSEDAIRLMQSYRWDGGETQLEAFCERLFLTASRKTVDTAMVRSLYEELYPVTFEENGNETVVVYRQPEAQKIEEFLLECQGIRELAAQKLGISTTTLWRRMKKYGIRG